MGGDGDGEVGVERAEEGDGWGDEEGGEEGGEVGGVGC